MFFVEARYHRDPRRAGAQVRYISHREEGLTDGRRRELYGIGERYRALRGDEPAIRQSLHEDGRGLRNPAYFRFILTVDNPSAERFRRFDGHLSERVLRDAVEKTFRGAARGAQGVFAVHQHGGHDRPAHPHVHALLSPRFDNRMAVHISPVRFFLACSVRSAGSIGPEKPWRACRSLASATEMSTESSRCCHSGRRHGGVANWSSSRPRGGRCGSREATAGSSGGCGMAGAAPGGK